MRWKKKILYGLYLFAVTFLLLEAILRIYNPFHFRIRGNNILLPANKTFIVENKDIPVLDKTIIHYKNNLGFRGPAKPDSLVKYLSIISAGGSTTECQYLNEDKTWSAQLYKRLNTSFDAVWLNNAGLAGHSTFGHIALLKDHISTLKPKVVIFLVGCNDVERDDLNESDRSNMKGYYANLFTFFSKNSEVCNVIVNLIRTRRSQTHQLGDTYINIKARMNDTLVLPDKFIQDKLASQKPYLLSYEKRLGTILELCRQYKITPVFVTQPSLFGVATDSATGAHLGVFKIRPLFNGKLWWQTLECYNDVTRKVTAENKILLIDLARRMPKSSYYFYDMVHFTNEGAEKVASILYPDLNQYLSEKFPHYIKH